MIKGSSSRIIMEEEILDLKVVYGKSNENEVDSEGTLSSESRSRDGKEGEESTSFEGEEDSDRGLVRKVR